MSPQLSALRDELLQVLLSPGDLHQLLDDAGLPVLRIATDLPLEGQLHLALKQAAIHNRLGVLLAHARRRGPEASLPHVDAHLAEHGSPPLPSPPRVRLRTAARPWVLLLFVLCWAAGALLLNRDLLGLYSVAYALGGILIRTFLPGLVDRWTMVPALSSILALLLLGLALLGPGGVLSQAPRPCPQSPPDPSGP